MGTTSSPGPDQAIGWVVAFACFGINFLMAGIARSVGVFYVALLSVYGVSREEAAKPFSTRISVRCIAGPIVGILGQRFGIRNVTASGSIIAAIGSILCFFAPNVFWITMFWGVIHGIGFGLSTVLHMLAIGPYFEKYKATALGFGFAGESVGAFIFPMVIELLLLEFDVKGMFLIIGGMMLNVLPMALLLKKPPWLKAQNSANTLKPTETNQVKSLRRPKFGEDNKGFYNSEKLDEENESPSVPTHETQVSCKFSGDSKICYEFVPKVSSSNSANIAYTKNKINAVNNNFNFREECTNHYEVLLDESTWVIIDNHSKSNELKNFVSSDHKESKQNFHEDILYTNEHDSSNRKRSLSCMKYVVEDGLEKIRSSSFTRQISLDGCFVGIECETKGAIDHKNLTDSVTTEHNVQVKCEDENSFVRNKPKVLNNDDSSTIHANSHTERNILVTFLKINVKPLFNVISLNLAAICYLFVGLLTVNIDYASDHGISIDESKFFVTGYSAADLFGRMIFGQVLDKKILSPKTYTLLTMLMSGLVVAAIPISRNYYYLMFCMSTCGFIVGALPMIFPILITTYMEKHEETIAFGCLNFIEGIIMLLMAPMIGYFRDNTGSYDGVFYILGAFGMLSGGLWMFEPLLLKLEKRIFAKKELESSKTKL